MGIAQIAEDIRNEVSHLDLHALRKYALMMGVRNSVVYGGTREEIINECIAIEQHTFVH